METVSVADAKARLSEVIDRVLAGEPVQITRRGKPVVQITAVTPPRPRVDVDALRRLAAGMTGPEVDSETWWRAYRDGDRY